MVELRRFDVCLIQLDPPVGSEISKTRLAVVISPDSMNQSRLKTLIIAPMTTTIREYFPTRVNVDFAQKSGQVALDQMRSIDRIRIFKILGRLSHEEQENILIKLSIIFQK